MFVTHMIMCPHYCLTTSIYGHIHSKKKAALRSLSLWVSILCDIDKGESQKSGTNFFEKVIIRTKYASWNQISGLAQNQPLRVKKLIGCCSFEEVKGWPSRYCALTRKLVGINPSQFSVWPLRLTYLWCCCSLLSVCSAEVVDLCRVCSSSSLSGLGSTPIEILRSLSSLPMCLCLSCNSSICLCERREK